jgi:hypothetical protein
MELAATAHLFRVSPMSLIAIHDARLLGQRRAEPMNRRTNRSPKQCPRSIKPQRLVGTTMPGASASFSLLLHPLRNMEPIFIMLMVPTALMLWSLIDSLHV